MAWGGLGRSAVAIIGMGCRFPGADGIDELWELLTRGRDAITEVPPDRFDVNEVYCADPAAVEGKTISRWGGFMTEAFGFDARFFGIASVEARGMDPQQRWLLQVAWEALEHAGIPPSRLAGSRCAVFVGQATSEYGELHSRQPGIREAAGGRLRAVTAGRLSYALDLRGPSMTIDTACSSSLVAVHLARQSLLAGECDLAIAAGVNFIHTPTDSITYSQAGMLSPTGRCRFGDRGADGFVRSEGVGVVILKRVSDAQIDDDPIRAVLLGSSVNSDGRSSGLLLQPAVRGQAAMLMQACEAAGVSPADLRYVEAHGTGTSVGDAVELRALVEVLGEGRPDNRPLWVGSVKSNIGHTEAAAGIAGLIKAALIVEHRTIPPSLHVRDTNPVLAGTPLRLAASSHPLAEGEEAGLVGVSSFGIAGTNAHIILGEPVPVTSNSDDNFAAEQGLFLLSARSQQALRRMADRYARFLEGTGSGRSLASICAATALRRDHHRYRAWVVGSSHTSIAEGLQALADGGTTPTCGTGEAIETNRRIVFVFPGQGSQWLGMARDLMRLPVFRHALELCDRAVAGELGWSVIARLKSDADHSDVDIVQPLLWSIQVGLAALWRHWGIEPGLCIGHSMGEVAAAYVSGALGLADAAAVICRRSQLLKRIAGSGSMLLVGVGSEAAQDVVASYDTVVIAAVNSPTATVLAGDSAELEVLADTLAGQGVLARFIATDVASHCPSTEVLRSDMLSGLAELVPTKTAVPMISTVTAGLVDGSELTADYWMKNMRRPVQFVDAVTQALDDEPAGLFLELSPHPALVSAIRQIQSERGVSPAAIPTLTRDSPSSDSLASTMGKLFAQGVSPDWSKYFGRTGDRVDLPMYAWDLRDYRHAAIPEQGGVRRRFVTEVLLDPAAPAVRIGDRCPIPPTTYLTSILDAVRRVGHRGGVHLKDVVLHKTVETADYASSAMQTVMYLVADGAWKASVELSKAGSHPTDVCVATVQMGHGAVCVRENVLDKALDRCRTYAGGDAVRIAATRRGVTLDAGFPVPQRVWRGIGEVVGQVHGERTAIDLLETCLLLLHLVIPGEGDRYEPGAFGEVIFYEGYDAYPGAVWSVLRVISTDGNVLIADLVVLDENSAVIAELRQITLLRVAGGGPADSHNETVHSGRSLTPVELLLRHAGEVLGEAPQSIDIGRSFKELGLDSLMAADLAERLRREGLTGVDAVSLLAADSVGEVAEMATAPARSHRESPLSAAEFGTQVRSAAGEVDTLQRRCR